MSVAALRRSSYRGGGVTVYLADTFTRPDQSGLGTADSGQVWGQDADAWTVASGRAHPPVDTTYRFGIADAGHADLDLAVTLYPSSAPGGNDLGLVARWTDPNNHVLFDVVYSAPDWLCRAFEMVAGVGYTGVTALINPVPGLTDNTSPFRVRLRVVGTAGAVYTTTQADLTTWVPRGTWTVNAALTGTRCGIAANGSQPSGFDNVQATSAP